MNHYRHTTPHLATSNEVVGPAVLTTIHVIQGGPPVIQPSRFIRSKLTAKSAMLRIPFKQCNVSLNIVERFKTLVPQLSGVVIALND